MNTANKIVSGMVIGTLAAEVLPGHQRERDLPHTHMEQLEQPRPVGSFVRGMVQSTSAAGPLSFFSLLP
jgi:hypothetical protein